MISVINLFLPLALQLLILYFLSRLLDSLVLRRLGKGWYLAITWPGVVVHELSHLIGCIITFTKVYKVHLFYPHGDTLGMVEHKRTRNPISRIIISIAPLFGVTTVIWLLTKWVFPEIFLGQVESIRAALENFSNFKSFFAFSGDYFLQYWSYITSIVTNFDFSQWSTYIFIFLMLTLSSHAAPSKVDLKHTYYGILILAVFFIMIQFMDQWLQVPVTWSIIQWLTKPIFFITNFITYGVIFTAISVGIMSIISLILRVFKRGVVQR